QLEYAALDQQLLVLVDLGKQGLLCRDGEYLGSIKAQQFSAGINLLEDFLLDFAFILELVPQTVDLVQDCQAAFLRPACAADVLAPNVDLRFGNAGIGSEDKQHRMRIGQHVQRQFGFGTDGIQARGIQNYQPLFQQRM